MNGLCRFWDQAQAKLHRAAVSRLIFLLALRSRKVSVAGTSHSHRQNHPAMRPTLAAGLAALTLAAVVVAGQAQAAPISETFAFSLGGFADEVGSVPPPITTITGHFTVTFDPAVSVTGDTSDLSNLSVSGITIGSAYAFKYSASGEF